MKLLLLLLVIGIVVWMITARRRPPADPATPRPKTKAETAAPMLACAHCGVHLPQSEAVVDAAGTPFCSDAHRLAGPR